MISFFVRLKIKKGPVPDRNSPQKHGRSESCLACYLFVIGLCKTGEQDLSCVQVYKNCYMSLV